MANHMKSRYGGKQGGFAAQLVQFQADALAAIDQSVQDIVIQIGESLINLSPVDTGRFKGNWKFTVGAPALYSTPTTDKEGDETIAALVAAVNQMEAGQVAYIVNNLVYAIPLEYGHSQQAPGGMVRITLARFQQIVDDVIRAHQL
jgi:hypothetical protein